MPAQPVVHGPSGSQPVGRVLIDRSTKCAPSLSIVTREFLGHVAGSGVAGCPTPGRPGPPQATSRRVRRRAGRRWPPISLTAATLDAQLTPGRLDRPQTARRSDSLPGEALAGGGPATLTW